MPEEVYVNFCGSVFPEVTFNSFEGIFLNMDTSNGSLILGGHLMFTLNFGSFSSKTGYTNYKI